MWFCFVHVSQSLLMYKVPRRRAAHTPACDLISVQTSDLTRDTSIVADPPFTSFAPCAANPAAAEWTATLQQLGVPAQLWPDEFEPEGCTKLDAVTFAVCWQPRPGLLRKCPNLAAVHSLGAGVDSILPEIPPGVPLARIVCPGNTGPCTHLLDQAS